MSAPTAPTDPVPVARLRHATVGYDDRPVLRDVDFRLDRGEVVAVLGPNGAGKSTLIKGLLGLARVEGSLELFGAAIGYVPQRHTVAGGLPVSVGEVVATGRLPRSALPRRLRPRSSAERAEDRAAVSAALAVAGLAGLERAPVATLSGGQQRRVLIARALAGEPDVLVMDEPTAGVDAAHQAALADTLRVLVRRGTTLLIVAHELGPLEPLVTRVVEVRDGRIGYDGPTPGSSAGIGGAGDVDPHPREYGRPQHALGWHG